MFEFLSKLFRKAPEFISVVSSEGFTFVKINEIQRVVARDGNLYLFYGHGETVLPMDDLHVISTVVFRVTGQRWYFKRIPNVAAAQAEGSKP